MQFSDCSQSTARTLDQNNAVLISLNDTRWMMMIMMCPLSSQQQPTSFSRFSIHLTQFFVIFMDNLTASTTTTAAPPTATVTRREQSSLFKMHNTKWKNQRSLMKIYDEAWRWMRICSTNHNQLQLVVQ